MYTCTKNEVSRSKLSKVWARTGQTDRQTDMIECITSHHRGCLLHNSVKLNTNAICVAVIHCKKTECIKFSKLTTPRLKYLLITALKQLNSAYIHAKQWHYWQGNGLVIRRLRVQVLAGHHCVMAFGKLLNTCVPLLRSSIIWYQQRGWSLAGKVTAGLVESNGSLPLGL